jgi:hypothetical protein
MALVLLLPARGSPDPCGYHAYETDSDGSFEFTEVPPGDYVLFAVDNLEFEYANPQVVRPYIAAGKRISVKAQTGESVRVELATIR